MRKGEVRELPGGRWLFILAALGATIVLLTGCPGIGTQDQSGASGMAGNPPSSPTWVNFTKDFMTAYCTRCHGNFTDYNEVAAVGQDAASRVQAGSMPQSAPYPTDAQISAFVQWVTDGLPFDNNGDDDSAN